MNEAEFLGAHGQGEPEVKESAEVKEEIEQQEELPELSDIEQKAYDQGWRPKEDFDGPKGNWKSASQYVSDGEWLGKIKELNQKIDTQGKEFEERLENTNKLNEARRLAEIADLKQQQRDAVSVSDTHGYDAAQKKIEDLEKQPEAVKAEPNKDPAIAAWEEENPWINEDSEKSTVAQSVWTTYVNKNPSATVTQALAHVNERISDLYPTTKTNARREQPNTSENPQRRPQSKNKELTMSDLTSSEQQEWNQYGSMMFKTEAAFLKAVKDARKK